MITMRCDVGQGEGGEAMECRDCRAEAATTKVTERLPSGGYVEAHYCWACLASRFPQSPPVGDMPRPRLTLGRLLLAIAAFALIDGLAVLATGAIAHGPPLGRATRTTMLAVASINLCAGMAAVYAFLGGWLRRSAWYRRTGLLDPVPKRLRIAGDAGLTWLSVGWVVASNLAAWPAAMATPAWIDGKSLYVVVATTTAAACTTAAWRCGATRPMLEAFRSRWAEGSFGLRILMASAATWPMLVNLAFRWDLLPRAMLKNAGPWILVPGLLATILGCRLAFMAGEALVSAHRPRRAA